MIFAPAYQFHIYLLCLRDCELFANLHLNLYTRPCPTAGAGGWRSTPTSACRCWPPTWRGWCGTTQCSASTRSGPPTACGAAQSTPPPPSSPWPTTPGCWPRSHIYTYLHNIYAISTQYLHNIYTYLRRAPSSTSCWCSPSCRRPAWCACCGCWAGSHPASASCPTLSTAPTTRSQYSYTLSTHYLHTICTLSAHYLHTICTLHRSALCTSVLRDHAVTTYQ